MRQKSLRSHLCVEARPANVAYYADDRHPLRVTVFPGVPYMNRLPMGSSPGQNRFAIVSLMMTTIGRAAGILRCELTPADKRRFPSI